MVARRWVISPPSQNGAGGPGFSRPQASHR